MGLGGRFDTPDFEERTYRYAVRCDRDTFKRIEAAARKAGCSGTAFVQRHFASILDEPPDDHGFSAGPFARQYGISEDAARLWNGLRRNADADNLVSGCARELANLANISSIGATACLSELIGARLLAQVASAAHRRPTFYRVMKVWP